MKALYLSLLLSVSGAALADDAAITKCRTLADATSRLACYDAIPLGAPPAPAPAAKAPAQDFGMETVAKPAEQPKSIESTIVGDFDGWGPNARIKLANGQVWRVVDDSQAVLRPMSNRKVKIVRNLFGTLFMEIEGTNNSPKVRRVQ